MPRHDQRSIARSHLPSARWPRVRVVVWAVTLVAITLSIVGPETWYGTTGSLVGLLTLLSASALAIHRSTAADRHAWRLVFAGVASAASGILTFGLQIVLDSPTIGLVGHGVVFVGYALLAVGIARIATPNTDRRHSDLDALVDMAVVAVVAAVLVWHLVGRHLVGDERLGPILLPIGVTHALLVVVLAALIARMVVRRRSVRGVGLLALGTTCLTVANLTYLRHVEFSDVGSWAATLWLAGILVLALAITEHTSTRQHEEPAQSELLSFGRVALTMAPIPIPAVLALWGEVPERGELWLLIAASTALTGLAAVRGARLARSASVAWERLSSRERLFQAMAANSSDVVLRVDRDGHPVPLPDHTRDEPTPSITDVDLGGLDREGFTALIDRAAATPGTAAFAELPLRSGDETAWLSARAVDLTRDADVGAIVVNLHDITSRKLAEQELQHQALHDPLTGLANRALFRDRLDHALSRRGRDHDDTVVLYIDLDGFKSVNDGLGHDAGDRLLRLVAERLASSVRPEETVARLGGDEFAILLERASSSPEQATTVAARVLQSLTSAFHLDEHYISVGASVGIAISDATSTAGSLLRASDVAMYQAKADGRGRWLIYEPSIDEDTAARLQLESDLVTALRDEQFQLVYQPVLQLDDDRVVGFEALLRWHHPTLGVLPPDRFIPTLERTGGIVAVGAWVIQRACAALADWQARFDPDLRMAVNVSGRQFEAPDLVDTVIQALADHAVDPSTLVLEMTETVLVDNPAAADQLEDLHRVGVRIAIDDFGTGYSSLSYLRRFPIDTIKIDRSFVATIDDPSVLPVILKGLLELSRTLELETIAEGIELPLQRDRLVAERCALGQGHLYAHALPAEEAEAILRPTLALPASSTVGDGTSP